MKANADKCHLIVSSDESFTAKIDDVSIKNSTEKKASQKLHALARISH